MMRYLVSFTTSVICIVFIFLFPFPDISIASRDTIMPTNKDSVKSFTIMSYTVLPETAENRQADSMAIRDDMSSGNPDNMEEENRREDEIKEDNKQPVEETGRTGEEKSVHNETEQGLTENTSGSGIVDYSPDFSKNKKPVYPLAAKRMRQQGSVTLKITANGTGSIISITIEKSSGYVLLDNAALEAVKKWDFAPVVRYGKPTIIRTTITFTLREKGES
jgi:TonB family protein